MLSGVIAAQLRARGHDAVAAVEDPSLVGLSDEAMLASAAGTGRTLVTANIRDFVPLDQRYRSAGKSHAGLVLISTKAFPQDRSFIGALVTALDRLLSEEALHADAVRAVVRHAALEAHFAEYPEDRPTLAEVAAAAAELDGLQLPLELIEQAAAWLATESPDASADDVLLVAAGLELARSKR